MNIASRYLVSLCHRHAIITHSRSGCTPWKARNSVAYGFRRRDTFSRDHYRSLVLVGACSFSRLDRPEYSTKSPTICGWSAPCPGGVSLPKEEPAREGTGPVSQRSRICPYPKIQDRWYCRQWGRGWQHFDLAVDGVGGVSHVPKGRCLHVW